MARIFHRRRHRLGAKLSSSQSGSLSQFLRTGPLAARQNRSAGRRPANCHLCHGNCSIVARRMSGHLHRFFTIKLSPEYLHTQLAAVGAALKPAIRDFLDNPERASAVVNVVDMPIHLLNYRLYLLDPPVESAAQDVGSRAKSSKYCPMSSLCRTRKQNSLATGTSALTVTAASGLVSFWSATWRIRLLYECWPKKCSAVRFISAAFSSAHRMGIPRYLRIKRLEKAGNFSAPGE